MFNRDAFFKVHDLRFVQKFRNDPNVAINWTKRYENIDLVLSNVVLRSSVQTTIKGISPAGYADRIGPTSQIVSTGTMKNRRLCLVSDNGMALIEKIDEVIFLRSDEWFEILSESKDTLQAMGSIGYLFIERPSVEGNTDAPQSASIVGRIPAMNFDYISEALRRARPESRVSATVAMSVFVSEVDDRLSEHDNLQIFLAENMTALNVEHISVETQVL